jgi:hypothetical protein
MRRYLYNRYNIGIVEMQEEFSGEMQNISPAGQLSFLRAGDHDLQELLNKLNKLSKKALSTLEEGLLSKDEKTRMDCAKSILKFQMDASKEISTDAMQRMIAEFRIKRGNGMKTVGEDEGSGTPILEFNSINKNI